MLVQYLWSSASALNNVMASIYAAQLIGKINTLILAFSQVHVHSGIILIEKRIFRLFFFFMRRNHKACPKHAVET